MRPFINHSFNYEYPIKIKNWYESASKLSISKNAIFRAKRYWQDGGFIVQYNEWDWRRTYWDNHSAWWRALYNIYYEYVLDIYFPWIKKFEEDWVTPIKKKNIKVKNVIFNRVIL